jgi:hypothetical protein
MNETKEPRPWIGLEALQLTEAQKAEFDAIRARLESEIPKGLYLSREDFAVLIGKEVKTLQNDEAPMGSKQYPIPIRLVNTVTYSRDDVLNWLTAKELESRARRIHRCQ